MLRAQAILVLVLLVLQCSQALAEDLEPETTPGKTCSEEYTDRVSIGHALLWYLPNRLLDLADIFRFRLRVGPGFALGVRPTKLAQVYLGSYVSVYAGLPGPRGRQKPKSPIGLETRSGIALSVLEAIVDSNISPDYSDTEFSASAQLLLVGADVGIDPVEIADFIAGLFFLGVRPDDY